MLNSINITMTEIGSTKSVSITEKQLARLALEIHGGGYNIQQTTNAMIWQNKVLKGEPIEFDFNKRKFTIETQTDVVATA